MSQVDLLRHVVSILEEGGIEYMITGSIASSLHGEPRATHDLDVVIEIRDADVPVVLAAFPQPQFYVDGGAIREAIRTGGMFNVIDVTEGDKVDFWMLTDEPFDRSRFSRRIRERALGIEFDVSSPEDTILAKLRWSKLGGGTSKPYIDALRVYEVQNEILNHPYLDDWANRLGVVALWDRLRLDAEPPRDHLRG
jgi:hypothetical protein